MEDKKLIAQALLDIARNSETTIISASDDKELIDAAKKVGIVLPSPDLAVLKTVYAEIDKVNLNGVVLPRPAVEKGLPTLIGKQINWEHDGAGRICGYTISAKINGDKIEIIGVVFKSLFPEEMDKVEQRFYEKKLAVSFEIWNRNPETGESVVHPLENKYYSIDPIIFHGTGLLADHKPACPKAIVYKLLANTETTEAEKIVDKIFEENLICASMAMEEPKCKGCNPCTCKNEKEVIIVDEILENNKEEKKDQLEKSEEQSTQVIPEPAQVVPPVEVKPEPAQVAEAPVEACPCEVQERPVLTVTEYTSICTETLQEDGTYKSEQKGLTKITRTFKDSRTEVENRDNNSLYEDYVQKYTVTPAELEEKVNAAKVEKDLEITELKTIHATELSAKDNEIKNQKEELGKKDQEIAELKPPIVEEKKEKELTVGTATGEIKSEVKEKADEINQIIANKGK
jgi:hypothetical protein